MFFERFSLLFQGFWGFGRDKKSLFFLGGWFCLPFSKKSRKGRTGSGPEKWHKHKWRDSRESVRANQVILGSDFGRTDFSRIFIFGPPDFFADFLAGFFLLIFVGKVPRKILQENPRENPPKFIQQKSSDTLLQIGWGK